MKDLLRMHAHVNRDNTQMYRTLNAMRLPNLWRVHVHFAGDRCFHEMWA
jgi:hypothetical protein